MIDFILLLAGISIIMIIAADFIYTVFIPRGAGFVTAAINNAVTYLFSKVTGNRGENRFLEYKWVVIVFIMLLSWMGMIWLGVTLVYHFDYGSVIHNQYKTPASFFEKLYFSGYTLSTLGSGDFVPTGNFWQILTSIVSFSGFITVTIGITYLVPVIHNIIEQNTLSLNIASLGESSQNILLRAYNGKNFNDLSSPFNTLSNMIVRYSKNHLAYPILHHVHNSDKSENTVLKLVSLDEALTILIYHVPETMRPPRIVLQMIRRSLDSYLMSVKNINPTEESPPLPDLDSLSSALNIRLASADGKETEELYEALKKRRCLLKAIIEKDGWEWDDLNGGKFKSPMEPIDRFTRVPVDSL